MTQASTFMPHWMRQCNSTSPTFRSEATSCWDLIWPQTELKDKRFIQQDISESEMEMSEAATGWQSKVKFDEWCDLCQKCKFCGSQCSSRLLTGNRKFKDTKMFYQMFFSMPFCWNVLSLHVLTGDHLTPNGIYQSFPTATLKIRATAINTPVSNVICSIWNRRQA